MTVCSAMVQISAMDLEFACMQEIPVHLVPSAETLVMKPATAAFLPLAQLVMMAFSALYDACNGQGTCVGAVNPCENLTTCARVCNESSDVCAARSGLNCDDSSSCTSTDKCDGLGNCVGTGTFCPDIQCRHCRDENGTRLCADPQGTPCNNNIFCDGTADVCNGFGDCVGTGTACTLCPNSCDETSRTCPCPPGVDSTSATSDPGNSDTSGAEFIRFSIELLAIVMASLIVL